MIEITLPLGLDSELHWKEEIALARQAQQEGKTILWKFDFGLHVSDVILDDASHFLALSLGVDHFAKTLALEYGTITTGVVLYTGDIFFDERMVWSASLCDYFTEWLVDTGREEGGHARRLFCMNVFAEFLHRLASYLPDEIIPYCFFEPAYEKGAFLRQLFSKERFGAIRLQREEKMEKIGVILPKDELCRGEVFEAFALLLDDLEKAHVTFKVIPENLLTEEWQGVEHIYALKEGMTGAGVRMLKGFEASGGEIIWRNLQ